MPVCVCYCVPVVDTVAVIFVTTKRGGGVLVCVGDRACLHCAFVGVCASHSHLRLKRTTDYFHISNS